MSGLGISKELAKRLSIAIKINNVTIKQVADSSTIPVEGVESLLNDTSSYIPALAVVVLAKYFNCSTDWLMGLTDVNEYYPIKKG